MDKLDKSEYDSKENLISNKKLVECEKQILKNNYQLTCLNNEIRQIQGKRFYDPEDIGTQKKIKDLEGQIRKIELENQVRLRCHEVNSIPDHCFDVACAHCKTLPPRPENVHRAVPDVRRKYF